VISSISSPVFLSGRNQYDCSDLVARYCLVTEELDLGELAEEPRMVIPNDLARAAGLIK
jgi:hypothetical protein